jgi:DNA-directed RNA polymerase beta subunit
MHARATGPYSLTTIKEKPTWRAKVWRNGSWALEGFGAALH